MKRDIEKFSGMYRRSIAILLAMVLLLPAIAAAASSILELTARIRYHNTNAIVYKDDNVGNVRRGIESHYGVAFSTESHPDRLKFNTSKSKRDGTEYASKQWHIKGEVVIKNDTTLREALDAYIEACSNAFVYEVIAGQVCLLPARNGVRIRNWLDDKVTLEFEKLSTVEALDMLAEAINTRYPEKKEVRWYPITNDVGERMPEPFYADHSLSLALKNVSVREALCRIMDASPVKLNYTCYLAKRIGRNIIRIDTNYKMPDKMIKTPKE